MDKKKVKEKATNSHKKNDDLFYTRSCEPSQKPKYKIPAVIKGQNTCQMRAVFLVQLTDALPC